MKVEGLYMFSITKCQCCLLFVLSWSLKRNTKTLASYVTVVTWVWRKPTRTSIVTWNIICNFSRHFVKTDILQFILDNGKSYAEKVMFVCNYRFQSSNWLMTWLVSRWTSVSTWPMVCVLQSSSNTLKNDTQLFQNWSMFSSSSSINVISTR